MENPSSAFIWNNQPLAALHQMAEMNSTNLLQRSKQTISQSRNVTSSVSPPSFNTSATSTLATPHGINDILSRNINLNQAALAAASSVGSRLFFNPPNVNIMSATSSGHVNKHFQEFRSLYPWMSSALLAPSLAKNINVPSAQDGSISLHDESRDRRGKKNTRPTFSGHQIFALEKTFEQTKYLAGPERAKLAYALGMSESQVKVWFQNRRTKHRKKSADNLAFRGQKSIPEGDDAGDCESDSKSDCEQ